MFKILISLIIYTSISNTIASTQSCNDIANGIYKYSSLDIPTTLYELYRQGKLKISKQYKERKRYRILSTDPDHNNKVTFTSKLEAVTGLEAEQQGILKYPIKRGPPGTEFIDGNRILWDVKTPISPSSSADWTFSPAQSGNSIKAKLLKSRNIRILLDITYLSFKDLKKLESWINRNIPNQFQKRIKKIIVPIPFEKSLQP